MEELSVDGWLPIKGYSGQKMSKMVNVKVIQTDIFEKVALIVIDNGMSNNNKANQ